MSWLTSWGDEKGAFSEFSASKEVKGEGVVEDASLESVRGVGLVIPELVFVDEPGAVIVEVPTASEFEEIVIS